MQKSNLGWFVLVRAMLMLLASMHFPLWAQNLSTPAAMLTVNRIDSVWRFNADATYTQVSFVERQALSDTGAQVIGKFAHSINKSLERYELLEAYTQKADGRRINVEPNGIQVQQGVTAGGYGASWPDVDIRQVTFPDVQVGDRTALRYRRTTLAPALPHWAAISDFGVPNVVYERMTIQIQAPRALKLNVFSSGWKEEKSVDGDQEVWRFALTQPTAALLDSQPANTMATYPRVYASTLKTNAELVALYAQQANEKAQVTEEIASLVSKITEGAATPLAKAAALHAWVRKNIRYVAVYLGTGGFVPHDVAWILKNHYGDCKDQALLLQTLLKAVGIEAVPVLINTTNEYVEPALPIGFNHAIVYIPSLGLFADPTDSRIPLGALPWADADKPVAVALTDGAKVMRTPAFNAANNTITIRTQLEISKTGKAVGFVELATKGLAATTLQDRLTRIPTGMADTAVQKLLEESHLRGRGFARYPAVQRDAQSQTLKITDLEIDNLLNDPNAGTSNPHPMVNLPFYILSNMGNYAEARRSYAFACAPGQVREEFKLTFDPAYHLLRVPQDLKESQSGGLVFEAHYERDGNTVTGWRELTQSQPGHVCSPADYQTRKPMMNRIAQHLRSGILYQQ